MKEYIIKIDEDKKDIMGNCPLVEKPQELVRCKDCWHGDPCNDGGIHCEKDIGTIETSVHKPDWFCADGERKGNE